MLSLFELKIVAKTNLKTKLVYANLFNCLAVLLSTFEESPSFV